MNAGVLKVQLDKSEFLHKEIEFLGYIITSDGIKPNIKKIEVIENYPEPSTIKELRSFLGMMGYYRRFVKDFAKIAKPLTNLLRGEGCTSNKKIKLNEIEKTCFRKMRSVLSSSDILIYPDFNKPFLLTTDASDYAIGAVLSQGETGKDKPIHFASRTLSKSEEGFSVPEKEMLAIFWALQTFRNYLYGAKFKILTDHQPLTFSLSAKNTNAKLKRWKAYLEEHDYTIEYKPGKSNVVADALSRMVICSMTATQHSADDSDDFFIISTEAPLNVFKRQVIINQGPDKVDIKTIFGSYKRITISLHNINESSILQVLKNNFDPSSINGLLTSEPIMGQIQEVYRKHFGNKRTLKIRFTQKLLQDIEDENEQWDIIQKEHKRAHRCAEENSQQIFRKFYFPKLRQKTNALVTDCHICHENKYDRNPIKFPLQKTPIPRAPFEIAHIDILFLENHYVLTYIDKFSKFAQIKLIQSRAAVDIIPAVKEILTKYHPPKTLVMDGEKSFGTYGLTSFYESHQINTFITATGRSEMNGVVERFHSTLLEIYRITKIENPSMSVPNLLELSVHKYNHSIHSSTKYTPTEIILPSPRSSQITEEVYKNLKQKQKKDLSFHNKTKHNVKLNENQEVYEKTRARLKHKPRYKKVKILEVNKSTVRIERDRKVHKNDLKVRKI